MNAKKLNVQQGLLHKGLMLLITVILPVTLLILGLSGCDGCNPIDNTVVIEYEETAVFSEFDTPPPPGGLLPIKTFAGQGLFVTFRIISIQNKASGAKDFSFDPHKVYSDSKPRAKMSGGVLSPYSTVNPRLVQKGTTASPVGRIILLIEGDPIEIKKSDNFLLYESGAGESVIFTRRVTQLAGPGETAIVTPTFTRKQNLQPATPNNLP
ncbi:MAG: hypothetical protein ACKVUS_05615 [Saprospiraceae bacterium]